MKKSTTRKLRIVNKKDTEALRELLASNAQLVLPMLELIEHSKSALNGLVESAGRVMIEALLDVSAAQIAGPKQQGKRRSGLVRWYGRQPGRVCLSERKIAVQRPRLRSGEGGEVPIPAYESLSSDERLRERMLELLMRGVSTRHYEGVLPEMAESLGVSKSEVSREAIQESTEQLRSLCERSFKELELLVIYLDGIAYGHYQVIAAVGVDEGGSKHVLGIREGATENSTVVGELLRDLVARGVDPNKRYLFVIDGSKALRKGIDEVFGANQPVQRCRNHKVRNVVGYLPEDLQPQVRSVIKAAYKLGDKQGRAKIEKQARWLEKEYPSAAASLLEGLDEMFTINRLGLTPSLMRCLGTTNLIDSSHSGMRLKTGRVTRWRNGQMVMRWAAASLLATEKHYRKIQGYEDLWILKAALGPTVAPKEKAA